MARAIWSGAISFGLVSVPVQLFTAVRTHELRFKQLHRSTLAPVKQKRVDERTGEEVAYTDIVKGYEIGEGTFVTVEKSELEELDPEASRLICIQSYVRDEEIDPVYYNRPYYLAPQGEIARKPYRLLADAMQRSNRVAIATFVMRNREHLAALRVNDGLLVLSTMHYADEIADPVEIREDLALDGEPSEREVSMAEQLISSMEDDFDPTEYRDRHRDRVLEYLQAKAEGETVELEPSAAPSGNVIDLMAALEASLNNADPGNGYDDLTRDELYELAKERQIPGRSSLSRQGLIDALKGADTQAAS